MRNIKLVAEFDGAPFSGWQYQPERRTVQNEIQDALEAITRRQTTIYGCSRTDAGVSARGYVANFHTDSSLAPEQLRRALNYHLPQQVHVRSAEETGSEFHARFNAKSKVYEYRMVRGYSPLRHARVWELRYPVDAGRVAKALRLFTGRKNFQPFCLTRDTSGICTVMRLDLAEANDEIRITVQGNRFLYKMVRRIVGAAAAYGAARITLADIRAALAGKKHRPYRTAPAAGLLLDSVQY